MHGKPTVLMYSHDSYGLGHLRRTLALAKAFVEHDPGLGVLIPTGSTVSNTRVVTFFSSWPLVGVESLVAVGVLLCFGSSPPGLRSLSPMFLLLPLRWWTRSMRTKWRTGTGT